MTYAKRLFIAPMSMLAQAAGVASMPFFASLWSQDKRSRIRRPAWPTRWSRVASLGLAGHLGDGGWVAVPLVDLLFTGGRFSAADARACAAYFAVFSVSLFLWSAQAIYSRAFYAAGNTPFAPMVAVGTLVTMRRRYRSTIFSTGPMAQWGWQWRRIVEIAMQTLLIAMLLHRWRMVSLAVAWNMPRWADACWVGLPEAAQSRCWRGDSRGRART